MSVNKKDIVWTIYSNSAGCVYLSAYHEPTRTLVTVMGEELGLVHMEHRMKKRALERLEEFIHGVKGNKDEQ